MRMNSLVRKQTNRRHGGLRRWMFTLGVGLFVCLGLLGFAQAQAPGVPPDLAGEGSAARASEPMGSGNKAEYRERIARSIDRHEETRTSVRQKTDAHRDEVRHNEDRHGEWRRDEGPRRHRRPGVQYRGRYYPFWGPGYGPNVYIEDHAPERETVEERIYVVPESTYEVIERDDRRWVKGHNEDMAVEEEVRGETVELYEPALFRERPDGSRELLEPERWRKVPKVRQVIKNVWVPGHFEDEAAEGPHANEKAGGPAATRPDAPSAPRPPREWKVEGSVDSVTPNDLIQPGEPK